LPLHFGKKKEKKMLLGGPFLDTRASAVSDPVVEIHPYVEINGGKFRQCEL
jgi:hypothetical protein